MNRFFDERVRMSAEDASAMLNMLGAVNDQGAIPEFRGRLALDRSGVQVTFAGMTHANFTDMNLHSPLRRLSGGGAIDRFRALEVVDEYVCSFFERELLGKLEPLLDGDSSRFPEAKVKVWPKPAGASQAPRQTP